MPNETDDPCRPISDEEARRLILALGCTRGDRLFSDDECQVVLDWACLVRTRAALLELVLNGQVGVDVADGEPYFRRLSPEENLVRERVLPRARD